MRGPVDFRVRGASPTKRASLQGDKVSSRAGDEATLEPAPKLIASLRRLFPLHSGRWNDELDARPTRLSAKAAKQIDDWPDRAWS